MRGLVGALLCALAMLAAACGGGDDEGGGGGSSGAAAEPVTLQVGVIPIADVAPLHVGMEQGFFEEEKLTIEPKLAEGGAAIMPAVMAGDDDIGFSERDVARHRGIEEPAGADRQPGRPRRQGPGRRVRRPVRARGQRHPRDRGPRRQDDLGEQPQHVGPLTISNALEKVGVDPKSVKFLEVPFPDAVAAPKARRVDAIWVVEPFRSQAAAEGFRLIMTPFEEAAPNHTVASYFASKQYIEKNPEVVARFVRAMYKSLDYAQDTPEAVRKVVPTYTQISEAAVRTWCSRRSAPSSTSRTSSSPSTSPTSSAT